MLHTTQRKKIHSNNNSKRNNKIRQDNSRAITRKSNKHTRTNNIKHVEVVNKTSRIKLKPKQYLRKICTCLICFCFPASFFNIYCIHYGSGSVPKESISKVLMSERHLKKSLHTTKTRITHTHTHTQCPKHTYPRLDG